MYDLQSLPVSFLVAKEQNQEIKCRSSKPFSEKKMSTRQLIGNITLTFELQNATYHV